MFRFGSKRPRQGAGVSACLVGMLLVLCGPAAGPVLADETGSIEGVVSTHDGDPAPGALITLVEGRRVVVSDERGTFRFEGITPGLYHLRMAKQGVGQAVAAVTVSAGEAARVERTLHLEIHREEITVTASPSARLASEVFQPVAVITGEDLDLQMQATLGETLAEEDGVSSTWFGPGASRPVIRGLGADRTRIVERGIEVGDASGISPDHAVSIDPAGAERIEIVRGPATLLYGGGAVGGVINVIDQRIPTKVPVRPVVGAVRGTLGSVADERSGAVDLRGGGGNWAWSAGATRMDADDYETPAPAESDSEEPFTGVLENSAVEVTSYRVGATRLWGRSYLGLSAGRYDTTYGVPGHGHHHEHGEEPVFGHVILLAEEEEEEETVSIDLEQNRLDLEGRFALGPGWLEAVEVRGGHTDYEHVELEGSEVGTRFESDGWELRTIATHRPVGRLTGAIGLQFGSSDLQAFGEEAFLQPTQTDTRALFVYEELALSWSTVMFGARFEQQDVAGRIEDAAYDRDFSGLSASAGLTTPLGGNLKLAASLSRAVRLPRSEELYSFGEHAATRSFEIGDPNLDEEMAHGFELSLRRDGTRFDGEVNVFVQRFDDFIYARPIDGSGVMADVPVYLYSQDDAEFQGFEAHADVELLHSAGHRLALEIGAEYVRAERRRDGEPLPFIPPLGTTLGLHYRGTRWWGSATVETTSDQDRVFCETGAPEEACETATDGYSRIRAALGVRLSSGKVGHELVLRGRNLGDRFARVHTSRLKDVAPLPGRDLSLIYRVSF